MIGNGIHVQFTTRVMPNDNGTFTAYVYRQATYVGTYTPIISSIQTETPSKDYARTWAKKNAARWMEATATATRMEAWK